MTHKEAVEAKESMQNFSGYAKVIKTRNHLNPESYYVDYVQCGSMSSGMREDVFSLKISHDDSDCSFFNKKTKHNTLPPTGRNQKSHNLITAMNTRKRY